MSTTRRHLTKTELAANWLRERIRVGELEPGQRLRVDELAAQLDMSPTPVREALRLLQNDRLLDYRAHIGHIVASPVAFAEILQLRLLLEPLATELAVPKLNQDHERLTEVERLHESYRSAVNANRGSQASDRNALWHAAIYDASGWTYLPDLVQRMWDVFPWRTLWTMPGHIRNSLDDHELVMAAIRANDAAAAAAAMRAHVEHGGAVVLGPPVDAQDPPG